MKHPFVPIGLCAYVVALLFAGCSSRHGATDCAFTQTGTISPKIATVGIVTWSTTLPHVASATIEFGPTTSYGMTAPVDLDETDHRTLLLGMKASSTYHYRIVATKDGDSAGGATCTSPDYTLATGALPNDLLPLTVTDYDTSNLAGEFLITGQFTRGTVTAGSPAYILDGDGDYVWWYFLDSDVSGARMSYDGKFMWLNSVNVPSQKTVVHRVSMDGLVDQDLSSQFTGLSHQLTVLPGDTIAYYAYSANQCDDIKERAPDGTVKTIVNARTAHGGSTACHVNDIQYSPEDDTLVFSDLDYDNLTKVTRTGATVWVLNGLGKTLAGDGWIGGQHGLHVLERDRFLIFNNNTGGNQGLPGTGDGSTAIEVTVDPAAKTVSRVWSYTADPPIQVDIMGDVQRLENGNTIVAYSTAGVVHEVDANGTVLREIAWPLRGAFGYIESRPTLYGPPPK